VDGGLETGVLSLGAWGENKAQMGGDPNDGKMINMDEKYMLIEFLPYCPKLQEYG
jgi:hypothetical protein